MKSGLTTIQPHSTDYSLLHTFGAISTGPEGLPANFSNYDGEAIPDQDQNDTRFPFLIPPLPEGCTGEAGAFDTGLQDGVLYNPQDLYLNTPPGDGGGRDMRSMLSVLINRGVKDAQGNLSPKRTAYFNCYGAGAIDDFDAARIALWINQYEKRNVYIGSYWYWGDMPPTTLTVPASFNTVGIPMHCYLATGWMTWGGQLYLEVIPWVGETLGEQGRFYMSRPLYNALMGQPGTAAFTITKTISQTPVPIGVQAIIDNLIYTIRQLFRV